MSVNNRIAAYFSGKPGADPGTSLMARVRVEWPDGITLCSGGSPGAFVAHLDFGSSATILRTVAEQLAPRGVSILD